MSEQRRALITGITGQDGSYLAEFLLERGYLVFGLVRRSNMVLFDRIAHVQPQLQLLTGDLLDEASLLVAMDEAKPDEIYHLAAQSVPQLSLQQPVLTSDVTGTGTVRVLSSMRRVCPEARYYQASSSEIFGVPKESPQHELSEFRPRSPYGLAKVYAHMATQLHREHMGLHASAGILFNHESPRRGIDFVTRKITHGAALCAAGHAEKISLGNLDARRDWGFAGDYVRAMWLMLQQDVADDYVVATGETHSVRELCEIAFGVVGLNWQDHVEVQNEFVRPDEVVQLVGDPTKARTVLGWKPEVSFEDLIRLMVEHDVDLLRLGKIGRPD